MQKSTVILLVGTQDVFIYVIFLCVFQNVYTQLRMRNNNVAVCCVWLYSASLPLGTKWLRLRIKRGGAPGRVLRVSFFRNAKILEKWVFGVLG